MNRSETVMENLMQNRTAAEHVYELVRREITIGQFKPGQRLVERKLTERFGVSRTPVREALRKLVNTQLAVNVPYRGIMVRRLSFEFARNIYDVRLGIEGIAAYYAAQRGTDEEHRKLEELFREIDDFSKQGKRNEVLILNNEFHKAIAEAAHNDLLAKHIDELWIGVNLVRASAWEGNTRAEESVREHEQILRAVVKRDAETARRLSEGHVRSSWSLVEVALEQQVAEK